VEPTQSTLDIPANEMASAGAGQPGKPLFSNWKCLRPHLNEIVTELYWNRHKTWRKLLHVPGAIHILDSGNLT